MNRRVFIQLPLVAAPVALAEANTRSAKRPKTGIKVDKDQDRFHEKLEMGRIGSRIDTKVSSSDLERDLYIYESRTIGKGGPPLHVHPHQDEWIYVLEGTYEFQVGQERYPLKAGDSLLAPRQVPHAFMYTGEGLGKMLIVFQPAGKMEAFFHEAAKRTRRLTEAEQKAFFRRHDLEIVGPMLGPEETKYKP